MNKQGSFFERLLIFALLYFAATFFFQRFFNNNQNTGNGAPRTAPALSKAFEGIAPGNGTRLTPPLAAAELKKLQAAIASNSNDEYSYWARLRSGLIEQYGLNDGKPDLPTAQKLYDEVINYAANDPVDAQALYQKGDAEWREYEALPTGDEKTAK